MHYKRPEMEFWDLEESITTALNTSVEHDENEDGDFNGGDVEW